MVDKSMLKMLSIRARMAYCILCLENTLNAADIDVGELKVLLEELWKFTSSDRLDEWEERIRELTPYVLLDDKFDIDQYVYFDRECIYLYRSLYQQLPQYIIDIIDYSISVGVDNIYGGTSSYSPDTLASTVKVIDLCQSQNIPLPAIEKVLRYSFSSNNGWGENFERADLK
jgi:hypothetical protein